MKVDGVSGHQLAGFSGGNRRCDMADFGARHDDQFELSQAPVRAAHILGNRRLVGNTARSLWQRGDNTSKAGRAGNSWRPGYDTVRTGRDQPGRRQSGYGHQTGTTQRDGDSQGTRLAMAQGWRTRGRRQLFSSFDLLSRARARRRRLQDSMFGGVGSPSLRRRQRATTCCGAAAATRRWAFSRRCGIRPGQLAGRLTDREVGSICRRARRARRVALAPDSLSGTRRSRNRVQRYDGRRHQTYQGASRLRLPVYAAATARCRHRRRERRPVRRRDYTTPPRRERQLGSGIASPGRMATISSEYRRGQGPAFNGHVTAAA